MKSSTSPASAGTGSPLSIGYAAWSSSRLADVRDRAELVRARDHAQAAVLLVRVVEVDARGGHGVARVGEVGVVLVHREGSAALGRLHEHLRVVELHVRADHARQRLDEARVRRRPHERRVVVLEIVEALQHRVANAVVRSRRRPGVVHVEGRPGGAGDDRVDGAAHLLHLGQVEHAPAEEVPVLAEEPGLLVPLGHAGASCAGRSSPATCHTSASCP